MNVVTEVRAFFEAALLRPVERDHTESTSQWRRRQIIVAIALVVGAFALGRALAVQPGDPVFYLATVGVARASLDTSAAMVGIIGGGLVALAAMMVLLGAGPLLRREPVTLLAQRSG